MPKQRFGLVQVGRVLVTLMFRLRGQTSGAGGERTVKFIGCRGERNRREESERHTDNKDLAKHAVRIVYNGMPLNRTVCRAPMNAAIWSHQACGAASVLATRWRDARRVIA